MMKESIYSRRGAYHSRVDLNTFDQNESENDQISFYEGLTGHRMLILIYK